MFAAAPAPAVKMAKRTVISTSVTAEAPILASSIGWVAL
jgi:hypothetical protein